MGFWTALQFLTIIPAPCRRRPGPGEAGTALVYFPVVGGFIGASLFLADRGLAAILAPAVGGALGLALWVFLSGAMHLDAVADTCDGLAGNTPARRLEIMADSHTGAYGIVGVVMVLLIKYAAIISLPAAGRLQIWLLTPVLGSWAMVLALFAFPYAHKSGGLAQDFKQGASRLRLAVASLISLAAAIGLMGWQGALLMASVCLITLIIGGFFNSRLGGLTGDIYGTIKETTEAAMLVVIPVIAAIA